MCSPASLLVRERLEPSILPTPSSRIFRSRSQWVGSSVFFPVPQVCGSLGNVCLGWSLGDGEQASWPPRHLSGP